METLAPTQKYGTGDRVQNRSVLPPVNITATQDEYLLEVEMPGVNKAGLEISVEGSELTLVGKRQPPETTEGEIVYRESNAADYRRTFEIGSDIDTDRISAEMNQGIVKLHLPKSERVKPRRIQIAD